MRKWRIERLKCQNRWTWIAVGPDRVLRYFGSQPEALAYVDRQPTPGWLRQEFQRAKNRREQVPEYGPSGLHKDWL